MATNKLTDVAIKKTKPKEKPYKLSDCNGMYLEIMPNGSKYWRIKYRFGGKEKRLAFSIYPLIFLSSAREKVRLAKLALLEGNDPGEKKTRKIKKPDCFDKRLFCNCHFAIHLKHEPLTFSGVHF